MAYVRVRKGYHRGKVLMAQAAKACKGLPKPQYQACVSEYIKKAKRRAGA
jgi:hypothetical protein